MLAYIVLMMLKIYLLNTSILMASETLHDMMVNAILRSPTSYFDSIPSSILVNKFSSDLGIIDREFIDSLSTVI